MPFTFLRGYYPTHLAIIAFVLLVFLLGSAPDYTLQPLPDTLSPVWFLLAVGMVFKYYKPAWPASPVPFNLKVAPHYIFLGILAWSIASDTSQAILLYMGINPMLVLLYTERYMAQGYIAMFGAICMAWVTVSLFTRYFQPLYGRG